MRFHFRTAPHLILLAVSLALRAHAMEIDWVHTTGQEPVENAPLVVDFNDAWADAPIGAGAPQPDWAILTLNRTGQLMKWDLNGRDIGAGQDGTAVQLPEGHWTTTPAHVPKYGPSIIACSVEGLVIGMDKNMQQRWRYSLPGKTTWGRAIPAILAWDTPPDIRICFGDESGAVTALDTEGKLLWTTKLNYGPCKAPVNAIQKDHGGAEQLLAASGDTLVCLDMKGQSLWTRKLAGEILSRPIVVRMENRQFIVCGAGSGTLYALSLDGQPLWELPIGDTIDSTITTFPQKNGAPLILFTGVQGNLYAVDADGHHVWTHLFRSKTRCRPLVLDATGNHEFQIVVSTYSQHVLAFGLDGTLLDDLRLQGSVTSSPAMVRDAPTMRDDFVVSTATMLAYRIKPGPIHTPYDSPAPATDVTLTAPDARWVEEPALTVLNPHGALLRVNLAMTETGGYTRYLGSITARSRFDLPLPACINEGSWSLTATVHDAKGKEITRLAWNLAPGWRTQPKAAPAYSIQAWATPAYGSSNEERLTAFDNESPANAPKTVSVDTLYRNEAGQGAFIVANSYETPVRVRITFDAPKRAEKTAFAGSITLRQAVTVPTLNGEQVADALPELMEGQILTLPAKRSSKVWCSVDAHGADAGAYAGAITITPLDSAIAPLNLDMKLTVTDLSMPAQFPLRLCTWDYVPNQWFPGDPAPALDDMARHGVSVFPRSTCLPPATANADGSALTLDWKPLDQELARLKGRGQILFQIGIPDIKFAAQPTPEQKRAAGIAYLHTFRDYLKQHGLDYDSYAFYPVDEPGLDYGKSLSNLTDAAEFFREADPKFRIYTDPVPSISWKDFQRIEPLIDVWCPNMRLVNGLLAKDPRIERIMKSGKPVWSYECVGQVKSLSPLRYNRADAWRASFFGLQGIGMWTYSTTPADMWQAQAKLNDEYALIYPAAAKPVPSARLEALRDGMEDIAAVKLLEDAVAENKAKGTKPELVAQAVEELRIAKTDIMELSDFAFMESRDFLSKGDRRIWHTWTDVSTYEIHRARIAELTQQLK